MSNKGVIVYRGDMGTPKSNYAKSILNGVTDSAAMDAFATAIAAHTRCNIAKKSFIAKSTVTNSEPGLTPPANVDRKAVYYFQDPTDESVHTFTIASPANADIENTDDGERVTDAAMAAVVGAINTATGKSYDPLFGQVVQQP